MKILRFLTAFAVGIAVTGYLHSSYADDGSSSRSGFFDNDIKKDFFSTPVTTTTTTSTTTSSTTTTITIPMPPKETKSMPTEEEIKASAAERLEAEQKAVAEQLNSIKKGAVPSEEEQRKAIEYFKGAIDRASGVQTKEQVLSPTQSPRKIDTSKLKGAIPKKNDIPAYVSVIVSNDSPSHLEGVLSQLSQAVSEQHIKVGDIFVIQVPNPNISREVEAKAKEQINELVKQVTSMGKSDRSRAAVEAQNGFAKISDPKNYLSLGEQKIPDWLVRQQDVDIAPLLDQYKSSTSPTWIIKHGGTTDVYAGNVTFARLFDSDGNYTVTPTSAQPKKIEQHSAEPGNPIRQNEKQTVLYANLYVPKERASGIVSEQSTPTNDGGSTKKYGYLPNCGANTTRRLEVYERTEDAQAMDYLFYAAEDQQQKTKVPEAPKKTTAIPYYNTTEIKDPAFASTQRLAQGLSIQCLPTRFNFVLDGGKNYIEYREGSDAWSNESTPGGSASKPH